MSKIECNYSRTIDYKNEKECNTVLKQIKALIKNPTIKVHITFNRIL